MKKYTITDSIISISDEESFVNEQSLCSVISEAEEVKKKTKNVSFALAEYLQKNEKVSQAISVKNCGSFLMFKQFKDKEQTAVLSKANFCKNPLCPMCEHRRAINDFNILKETLAMSQRTYTYHLVLAVPNVRKLKKEHLLNLKSKAVYFITKKLKKDSYYSSLEITYTKEEGFHPHLHVLLTTDNYISVSESYIKQMSHCWKTVYNKSDTEHEGYTFFIKGIKSDNELHEMTKYIVKAEKTEHIIDAIKKGLPFAIHGVRKNSSGGEIKVLIKQAKSLIKKENTDRLDILSEFDYFYRIFEFLTGKEKYVEK